jgi:predicted nucleotidyltransferase
MSTEQAEIAVRVIRKYFADAAVWLFGSRVDDNRKGGDFDFYIETQLPDIALPMARARGELSDSLGMKVDLAVNNHTGDKPIFRIAKASGIRLA